MMTLANGIVYRLFTFGNRIEPNKIYDQKCELICLILRASGSRPPISLSHLLSFSVDSYAFFRVFLFTFDTIPFCESNRIGANVNWNAKRMKFAFVSSSFVMRIFFRHLFWLKATSEFTNDAWHSNRLRSIECTWLSSSCNLVSCFCC